MIDCVYVAGSSFDSRQTRICVASIRSFYPNVPIKLLASGRLQSGLVRELQRYWDVAVANLPLGDYGWGFVKLEPLFGRPGEKFLVLDSDTALTGPILDVWRGSTCPFLVDNEQQSETDAKRLYFDWTKLKVIDSDACPPAFLFNSGQWFGTAGVLSREDFTRWIEWTMPRRLKHPECFMPGDQGVLNYVLNHKVAVGAFSVERRKIMRWPKHSMSGLDAEAVSTRMAMPLIVHWAGMKEARLQDMVGADLLAYFERQYYRRLLAGTARRIVASWQHALTYWLRASLVIMKLTFQKIACPALRIPSIK